MRAGLMVALFAAACFVSGCASSPLTPGGGLPLGRSGWEFNGGVDMQRRVYFVYFSRPFGARENKIADGWAK